MTDAKHAELLKLSLSERLLLVQDQWGSLTNENIPFTEWQKEELARRKATQQANPSSSRSWENVKRRIIRTSGRIG